MNTKKHFWQTLWFKNTILITIPSLISILGVVISVVDIKSQTIKNTIVIVMFVSIISMIISVIFFSNQEERKDNEYKKICDEHKKLTVMLAHLQNVCKTNSYTIAAISELSEKWSKNINSFANNVLTKGVVSDKSWDKVKYFDMVCVQCKNMIKQYCNNNDSSKISVGFIICREDVNGEKWVHMVSHSNQESTRPKACKNGQKLSECNYHFAELIKNESDSIEVAINNDEILRIFNRISKDTDLSKYSQYIAVPVYCSSNKILGIFEVITKYDCIIEGNKIELLKFVEENIIPYSNLIVLIEKINKGLYVKPDSIEKEQ